MIRLQLQTLKKYAFDNVSEAKDGPLREGQEEQEWTAIEDCLNVKFTNPTSHYGDSWSLGVLGCKSPTWILGIQSKLSMVDSHVV